MKKITEKLEELAVTLPHRVEEKRGTHIMSLGMDVGIDKDGELYIFEVNDGPDTTAVTAEVAYLRSQYYKFILQEKLGIFKEIRTIEVEEYKNNIKEKKNLKLKNKSISKDRDALREELMLVYKELKELNNEQNKIKNSTSWRLTSPIRKAGSVKKKLFGK